MALIPPHFLNSVVSIGLLGANEKNGLSFTSIATGFLVGKATGDKNKKGENLYRLFLVTNRHVFYNEKTQEYRKEVFLRFNTTEDKAHLFQVGLLKEDNNPLWLMHENKEVDLAILPVSAQKIAEAKVDYDFFVEEHIFFAKNFKDNNISTGDGLFVLGFPMSISGKLKNFVIVRQGIIARVDKEVLEDSYYYIDASAYPGNSGGPVVIKPEVVAVGGTKSNNKAGLIGVISSGETYSDVAVSQQTGEPKVIFTEQTGLVRVVPPELIFEVIDTVIKPSTTTDEAEITDTSSQLKNEVQN